MICVAALKCYICEGHAVFGDKGNCGDTFDVSKSEKLLHECNSTAEERYCRVRLIKTKHIFDDIGNLSLLLSKFSRFLSCIIMQVTCVSY